MYRLVVAAGGLEYGTGRGGEGLGTAFSPRLLGSVRHQCDAGEDALLSKNTVHADRRPHPRPRPADQTSR